jgi:hypothetical protein
VTEILIIFQGEINLPPLAYFYHLDPICGLISPLTSSGHSFIEQLGSSALLFSMDYANC